MRPDLCRAYAFAPGNKVDLFYAAEICSIAYCYFMAKARTTDMIHSLPGEEHFTIISQDTRCNYFALNADHLEATTHMFASKTMDLTTYFKQAQFFGAPAEIENLTVKDMVMYCESYSNKLLQTMILGKRISKTYPTSTKMELERVLKPPVIQNNPFLAMIFHLGYRNMAHAIHTAHLTLCIDGRDRMPVTMHEFYLALTVPTHGVFGQSANYNVIPSTDWVAK